MKKGESTMPSIVDVAREAGVSTATVSRAINTPEKVAQKTRRRVNAAIEKLQYSPEDNRSTLSAALTHMILIIIPDFSNMFFSDILSGMNETALRNGYSLLVAASNSMIERERELVKLMYKRQADGIIFLSPLLSDEELKRISLSFPLVQCCEYNEHADYPYVSIDDTKAAEIATEYLLSNGGSKIALINGPGNFKYARRRQEGFMNALQKAEVMIPKQWIVQLPEVSYEMAYAAICRLLNSDSRPNAFFTISDIFAAAVIRAAKRFHLHVPRDILVVGFDNIELSSMTTPSITTVNQPKFQMGYTACEMLLELLEEPQEEMKSLILDTELIIREST